MLPGALSPPQDAAPPAVQAQQRPESAFPGGLKVKFDSSTYDPTTGKLVFSGRVEARYDLTTITSEQLTLDVEGRQGTAEGGVVVTDPEGTIQSARLEFDWERRTGVAMDVKLQADNVRIEARRIDVRPETWELTDASGALARSDKPPVSFTAATVTLRPGRDGVARHVYLRVLGAKIGPVPRVAFSLRKRVRGIGIPSLTNRKGLGLGVTWGPSLALGDQAAAIASFDSFPRQAPGYSLEIAYSPLDPESDSLIQPRSDLGERFSDGWFDNIAVASPQDERSNIGKRRRSVSVGTGWNRATQARPNDALNVTKQLEIVGEAGEQIGGLGVYGNLRIQSIRPNPRENFIERALGLVTVAAPTVNLGRDLLLVTRADLFGTASEKNTFAWVRGLAGLTWEPIEGLTAGVAYTRGTSAGTPDFLFDPLVSREAFHVRFDYVRGPYTLRYLTKYDFDRKNWYDREYEIALVAQVVEPFILFRSFPSDTRFGVRFRLDSFVDRLQRRRQSR
ncbi:MAG: hypothetical protein KIT11_11520 [Fimbriimonadaceae bacterium]|nr:hypothetical protein [Fimbriimonadaceae bacterium]QYK55338.1 MAG: hypothetical protein KF733_10015 [Fimbriimonadaceae bacterium]